MGVIIYDTENEIEARILMLMNVLTIPKNIDDIYTLHFMSIYAYEYDFPYENINGDNRFFNSEFCRKREKICSIIKNSKYITQTDFFTYAINDDGKEYCKNLKSDYAKAYKNLAMTVVEKYKDTEDLTIMILRGMRNE
ncbi:MAG: ABC-three component system middle component 2 [Clostridia bacterium]